MSLFKKLINRIKSDPSSYPLRNGFVIDIDYMKSIDSIDDAIFQMKKEFNKKYGNRIGSEHEVTLVKDDLKFGVWSFGAYCKSTNEVQTILTFAEKCARRSGFKAGGKYP